MIGAILVLFIGILLYILLQNPCSSIQDSSQRAECYTAVAVSTGNVKYCTVNYYTQDCIEQADPQHTANKDEITALCEKVIDSSRRNKCLQYVNAKY